MSYVHCTTCARAYHQSRPCPTCVATPTDAVIAAYEAFVKAIAAAQPEEVGRAFAKLEARAPEEVVALVSPPPPRPPSRLRQMFLFAKSQFTRFQNASMNFGRALR